jgi:hypothetical protein
MSGVEYRYWIYSDWYRCVFLLVETVLVSFIDVSKDIKRIRCGVTSIIDSSSALLVSNRDL